MKTLGAYLVWEKPSCVIAAARKDITALDSSGGRSQVMFPNCQENFFKACLMIV